MVMYRRLIAIILIAAVFLSVSMSFSGNSTKAENTGCDLKNPKIEYKMYDSIYFGNYWQEDTNGDGTADKKDDKTPVKWRILEKNGNDALLMADKCLDIQPYYDNVDLYINTVKYKDSTLRTWLNDDFYNAVFSDTEKKAVKKTKLMDNNIYMLDYIYILDKEDLTNNDYGFNSSYYAFSDDTPNMMSQATATDYAIDDSYANDMICDEKYIGWWIRDDGSYDYYITQAGELCMAYAASIRKYVRPVLHVDLSLISYEDTESVNAGIDNCVYDCIYFGKYWQKDTNNDGIVDKNDDRTSVKWRVLSADGNDAFIMADKNLDYREYNNIYRNVTWQTCDIRNWLNNEFYNEAFDEAEKEAIRTTYVNNSVNPDTVLKNEENTTDRIYLLSVDEAINPEYGFPEYMYASTHIRRVHDTDYVNGLRAKYNFSNKEYWLLRNGIDDNEVIINSDGNIIKGGSVDEKIGIRPVLHIDLSKECYSYAGSVRISDIDASEKEDLSAVPSETPAALPTPAVTYEPEIKPTIKPTAEPEPSQTPNPTRNPATQPPDEKVRPWPKDAYCYEIDLDTGNTGGGSRYVKNSDGSVTVIFKGNFPDMCYVIPDKQRIDDYYRWVEIVYCDLDESRGVSVYDKFIDEERPWESGTDTKYDLGYKTLPEYAGECVKVIDLYSLNNWDDYITQIDVWAPTWGDEGYSKGGRITIKSIKLYADTVEPPPTAKPKYTTRPIPTARIKPSPSPSPETGIKPSPLPSPKASQSPAAAVPLQTEIPDTNIKQEYTPGQSDVRSGDDEEKLMARPVFSLKKKKQGGIRYIEIKLKKYEGEYIQVYVKNGKKRFKMVSFKKVKIKKYNGIFKIQYNKKNRKLYLRIRTYKIKGNKKIYSRYSSVKKIVT